MFSAFPFYKQLDQMDCGPTCLRMIAKYYGQSFSPLELRNKSFLTREGVSMLGISDAAEAIGFHTVGIKTSFEKLWKEVDLPCIVHWNQEHFVVVYKIRRKSVYVADPAASLLQYKRSEFEKCWLAGVENKEKFGVALLLEPTPKFYEEKDSSQSESAKKRLVNLLPYLTKYKRLIIQLFIGLFLGSLIQLALPFLTQSIVDVGINTRNVNFIYLILSGQLMLFIGRTSVELIRRWILLHLGARINISIISDFLGKLFKLPVAFFDGKTTGDLLQRIDDYARIERFLSSSTLSILFSFFNLFVFSAVLLVYNMKIFSVFALFSAIYLVYVSLFLKRRAELDYKKFQQQAHNQSTLIELIRAMPEIKLNNCETLKRWEWERIQARSFKLTVYGTRLLQFQDTGSSFLNELKNIIITVIAAIAVINGEMTLGMMLAVQYIIGQLNSPINEFISFMRDWQDAKLSYERIQEIHVIPNESDTLPTLQDKTLVSCDSSITIKDLCFQYGGLHSPKVLDSVDLIIPAGKVTAIVGVSGSGKTTLIKLLMKFYEINHGAIKIGNIDLNSIPSTLWRRQCGVVMQDGYIFSDSILMNIALSEDYDAEKILQAVKVANIRDFIESLPLSYNTKIGSNGIGLSQGQKQRILIARAIYKNPKFIFLDEATSALDANNEKEIVKNLDAFFKGRTVIIVAHRLSTVKNSDQIVVLENGGIKEVGTHSELTKTRGAYFELVKNQLELGN